jgi:hypothetical protein
VHKQPFCDLLATSFPVCAFNGVLQLAVECLQHSYACPMRLVCLPGGGGGVLTHAGALHNSRSLLLQRPPLTRHHFHAGVPPPMLESLGAALRCLTAGGCVEGPRFVGAPCVSCFQQRAAASSGCIGSRRACWHAARGRRGALDGGARRVQPWDGGARRVQPRGGRWQPWFAVLCSRAGGARRAARVGSSSQAGAQPWACYPQGPAGCPPLCAVSSLSLTLCVAGCHTIYAMIGARSTRAVRPAHEKRGP